MSVVLSDVLQSFLDIVMSIYLSSFQESLYLAFILSFLHERQKIGKIGKWRWKGEATYGTFGSHTKALDVTWLVQPGKEETEGRLNCGIQFLTRGRGGPGS